jgi:hypothetical protein
MLTDDIARADRERNSLYIEIEKEYERSPTCPTRK